jgi:Protein of unknown function (DUF3558)
MRKAVLMSGLACAAALGAAGCSGGTPSSANPPPVTLDPLEVGSYVDKPCTLLDTDQLSEYGVREPGVHQGQLCAWTPDDPAKPSFKAGAAVHTGALSGSSMRVSGFPAANQPDGATSCTVRVAVAPTQQIIVSLTGQDACHTADLLAIQVLGTIKRLSP